MLKKTCKSIFSLMFALVLFFSAGVTAAAADTSVDFHKTGSITVTLRDSGENHAPVPGGTFVLYRVADVAEQNGNLSYEFTADFVDCGLRLSDLNADGLAGKFADYIVEHKLEGTKKTADREGRVTFSDLRLGIFLIMQEGQAAGYYPISPFLVSVPMMNVGGTGWIYDVDAAPKTETKPKEEEPARLTVKKVWADKGEKHPVSVTAGLYEGDTLKEKVILNDKNHWTHTWTDLDGNKQWKIREIDVPEGYVVSYEESEMLITITNTSKLIQTGQWNWPVPVLAFSGLALIFVGIVLLRNKRDIR